MCYASLASSNKEPQPPFFEHYYNKIETLYIALNHHTNSRTNLGHGSKSSCIKRTIHNQNGFELQLKRNLSKTYTLVPWNWTR